MSLKLASNVSVYVKRKGRGDEFDCLQIVGVFSREDGVTLYNQLTQLASLNAKPTINLFFKLAGTMKTQDHIPVSKDATVVSLFISCLGFWWI